jgi:hypothetical protein
MIIYYWESSESCGQFLASNDQDAIEIAKQIPNLLVVYKESVSSDGIPYNIILEIPR